MPTHIAMPPNSNVTPATILLVEDDNDALTALQAVLELSNYNVIAAGCVRDALDLLDQHSEIELVISDIRMPDVDGLDLIRVLRHRFPTLPTILISGMPITDDDVVPREATQILTKPVAVDDLQRAIAERLRESRGRTGSAVHERPPRKGD
ncbi:MAG TPA: response regulator [Casimicrobiaceae bacterium]